MLIDCPACARSYHVNPDEIGAAGRAVVCPRCRTHWFVDHEGYRVEAGPDLQTAAVSARVPSAVAAGLSRPGALARLRPAMMTLAALACAMAVIGTRDRLVRIAPRMERLYAAVGLPVNVRGLAFAKVAAMRVDPVTIKVSGEIRNVAPRRVAVPRLAYDIRDSSGLTLASWTERPPARVLEPGQTFTFVGSPHDSPREGETIAVHFAP